MKICIVSSCGGHLGEVRALRAAYENYEHVYVVNDEVMLSPDMEGRTYFICHAERDWRVLVNFWEAWQILRREKPDVILSTGAGPVVPFALIGKLLGVRSIFVEVSTQVTRPSLTGRIMYHLAEQFFYQWRSLDRYFPKGTYGGLIL